MGMQTDVKAISLAASGDVTTYSHSRAQLGH
jgi:hypothetical protein